MEWHIWLVPLIAMAVWILGSLLRSGAEERQRNLQRQNPGGGPNGGRQPQRPSTDLDRFLQEVHRRRQASERREVPEAPPREPSPVPERAESRPTPRPVPPPIRQPQPPPRRPARPAPPPPARKPQTRTVEDPTPVVQVVLPANPLPVDQPPAAVPVLSEVEIAPGRQARKARKATDRDWVGPPPSLAALLSSPEGLRNAFILREVLDAPLCKRRGR